LTLNLEPSAPNSQVSLEALKSAGIVKATGYYRNLPLKVILLASSHEPCSLDRTS